MSNDPQTAGTSSPTPAATPAAAPAAEPSTLLTADPAAVAQPSAADAQPPTQADPAAAEAKPAEAKPDEKAEGAPEQYADFTAPEGIQLDAEIVDEFKAFAKEENLTQEKAQKFADLGAKIAQKTHDNYVKHIEATQVQWANDSRADKEFGGDKLDANMAVAKKALDTFGSPELSEMLRTSGLGNHPEIVRAFYRVGNAISEDKLVPGGKAPAGGDKLSKMYPTMNQS